MSLLSAYGRARWDQRVHGHGQTEAPGLKDAGPKRVREDKVVFVGVTENERSSAFEGDSCKFFMYWGTLSLRMGIFNRRK
jgi:hypothetical protein